MDGDNGKYVKKFLVGLLVFGFEVVSMVMEGLLVEEIACVRLGGCQA